MAVPSISTYIISNGSHRYGSTGGAAVMTSPSDSVTKVSAIISQTSGGAAIETVETTVKTSSDQFADRWSLSWPTTGITSSPYYVKMWATNADGNGPTREAAPYIYFPPTVAITAPANGSTLASASVTVAWTASDPYGISAQRVAVLHGADVLLDEAVGESDTSYAVPSSVAFLDGESYTFRVTARNGNGMEASADSTVAFSFDAPAAASVTITDDGATATITVDDPHYSESGATIAVDGSAIADSFTVFGNSAQDGTPTPSAPVAIESIESRNLQPFFSQDFSDTSYWFYPPFTSGGTSTDTTPTATQLSDGWAHVEWSGTVSRRQLTATTPVMPTDGSIKPSSTYALMVEVRNYSATGTNARMIFPATDGTKAPWTANSYKDELSNGTFLYSATTKADISAANQLRCFMVACNEVTTSTTFSLSFDIRISLYEGAYAGNYMPCGSFNLMACGGNLFANPTSLMRNGVMRTYLLTVSGDIITNSASTSIHGAHGYYPAFVLPNDGSITVSADVYLTGTHAVSNVFMAILDGKATPASDAAPNYTVGISKNAWTHLEHTFTIDSGHSAGEKAMLALMAANPGNTLQLKNVMLQAGSTATPYQPYEGTTYPIDLQGNSLRSLPDGTRDELRVGERVVLIKRCGETTQAVTDGVAGTVGVDVLSATGEIANGVQVVYKLAAPQEIDLGAVSDHPFIPEDGEMWVDGTTMEASLRPADYAGQPPISSVDIARVNPDGTWTLAQGVTEGQSAIDPLPPLGVPYRYALTSHAAGGGTKVAYVEHIVETRAWHLNFGNAAQEHVSYLYNPQATMTLAQGGESYHFADGGAGRGLPVFYPTTDRDMSGTLRFDTVLYGDSDILLDLCDRYPVAWLRDPFGHRWRAHVRPSVSHGTGQVWPVTIAWDAVRFEEV